MKKGHVIEQALLHHLQAVDELPSEYIVHPRLVVSGRTRADLLRGELAPEPTPALRELMRDVERQPASSHLGSEDRVWGSRERGESGFRSPDAASPA